MIDQLGPEKSCQGLPNLPQEFGVLTIGGSPWPFQLTEFLLQGGICGGTINDLTINCQVSSTAEHRIHIKP